MLLVTRGRPYVFERLYQSILSTSSNKKDFELILYLDKDDQSLLEYISILKTYKEHKISYIVGERNVITDTGYNECFKLSTGNIIMVLADDLLFHTRNWDVIINNEINKFDDKIVILAAKDDYVNKRRASHPIFHRKWVETLGYVFPPYFKVIGGDIWVTKIAKELGRFVYLKNLHIEHLHIFKEGVLFDKTHQERKGIEKLYNLSQLKKSNEKDFKTLKKKADERKKDVMKLKKVIEG